MDFTYGLCMHAYPFWYRMCIILPRAFKDCIFSISSFLFFLQKIFIDNGFDCTWYMVCRTRHILYILGRAFVFMSIFLWVNWSILLPYLYSIFRIRMFTEIIFFYLERSERSCFIKETVQASITSSCVKYSLFSLRKGLYDSFSNFHRKSICGQTTFSTFSFFRGVIRS